MTPLNSPERNEPIRCYDGWPMSKEVIDKLVEIEKNLVDSEKEEQKNKDGDSGKDEDQLNQSP